MSRLNCLIGLTLAGLVALAPRAEAQGVTNFTINVPPRTVPLGNDGVLNTPDDQLPITRMEVRVTMATADSVAFRILDPLGEAKRFPASGEMSPGVADPPEAVYAFVPPGGTAGDRVTVHPPAFGSAPQDRVYTIFIETRSDYNATTCSSLMAAAETWSIVAEGPANPRISGVCLLGFDLAFPNQQCQQPRLIPIVTPPAPLASVPGFPAGSSQLCATARPGVDALLVLDKSGSMASPALGTTPRTKIAALHAAVQDFVDVWTALRTSEGANAPNDRLGLVFFDNAAKWASQVGVAAWAGLSQGLDTFNQNLRNLIFNNVTQVPASGATAMGQGILKADSVFTTNTGNRKVVLLMSDGIQNVDPMIGVDSFVTPTKLNTYNQATPNTTTLVPHQANYQTYAVTIGTSSAVSAAINMAVARARNGFYINSEDNQDLTRPFFLELLQNFLHFNSYEIARMVSSSVSSTAFSTTFPLSSTTRMIAVTVQWPPALGALAVKVTPPGAQPVQQVGRTGLIVIPMNLPLTPATNPNSDWSVEVGRFSDVNVAAAQAAAIPIDLTVLSDDYAIDSEMTATSSNFVPGQPIQLEARVTEFGRLVKNIGGSGGGRAVVQLVRPGTSIGDLLSNNSATGAGQPGDPGTPADAKLFALLQQQPNLLQRVGETVTMADNGNGVYTATFTPQEPGHYNFLFGIEGRGEQARFSRQQLKSVHVRAIPDPGTTLTQATVVDGQLVITATPRTRSGSKLGPGFGNYIWFTAPNSAPVKAVDNLDGTYRATLGANARPVSMHFVDAPVVIGDSAPASELPGGLNAGNTVIATVPGSEPAKFSLWIVILIVILILLLLAIYLWRRSAHA